MKGLKSTRKSRRLINTKYDVERNTTLLIINVLSVYHVFILCYKHARCCENTGTYFCKITLQNGEGIRQKQILYFDNIVSSQSERALYIGVSKQPCFLLLNCCTQTNAAKEWRHAHSNVNFSCSISWEYSGVYTHVGKVESFCFFCWFRELRAHRTEFCCHYQLITNS